MSPIDLVLFAEHSEKLPAKVLSPASHKKENHTFKILTSHLMDYFMILGCIGLTSAFLYSGMRFFLVTALLQDALPQSAYGTFSASLVPFAIFNYFFFSYFMNHGQSWGLFMMKKRVDVQDKSFLAAFKWAAHSTFLCMSCGLYYLLSSHIWKNHLKDHDHLYADLVAYKDIDSFSLVEQIERWSEEEVSHVPEWQEAA